MIKISKSELREKLITLMELGLTNAEIATRLNEEFNADETNALTAMKVAQFKDAVGLKGWKPKKKSLFELIDDDTLIVDIGDYPQPSNNSYPKEELIAEDEFLTNEFVTDEAEWQ
jgi:hypothetical protein